MSTLSGSTLPQIGSDDTVADVLGKTSVARRWIAGEVFPGETVLSDPSRLTFIMRVSAHIPASSPAVTDVFEPAFRRLHAMSGGAIQVDTTWGGKAHPEREGIQALVNGVTDLCPVYSPWDADAFPAAQALSLPNLFGSAELGTAVAEALYGRFFRRDVEAKGILMGRMVATGGYNLYGSRAIQSAADLQGLRVACSDGTETSIYAAIGCRPVPGSTPEAVRMIVDGAVDAVSMSDSAAITSGLASHVRFRTPLDLFRINMEYCLSRAFFTALPDPLQRVLNAWFRGLAQAGAQLFYGLEGARAREKMAALGIHSLALPWEQQALVEQRVQPVARDLEQVLVARGYDVAALMAALTRNSSERAAWSSDRLMLSAVMSPLQDMMPLQAC